MFRLYILKKYGDTCWQCGKKAKVMQCGHIIPKTYGNIFYFNEHDVIPQCSGCNMKHSRDTKPLYDLFILIKGQSLFNKLWNMRNRVISWIDLEGRYKRYKKYVDEH